MRIAVLIPLYQHRAFIARTLESVLAQTRPADRVIVIDDGSTDGSFEEAQRFAPRGIEVLHQENQGVSATVHRLLSLADDCDLVVTLDSDDSLAPGRLARAASVFENDPKARLLVTGLRLIDENDIPLPADHPRRRWVEAVWTRWQGEDTDVVAWAGQANFAVSNSNFVARREFFAQHPPKAYRYSYDYALLLRAALEGSLRIVPDPLLDYRIHGSNTMNTQPAPLVREQVRLWLDLHRDLASHLPGNPALRDRFYRLIRASWNNVSALHTGVLQSLLAECARRLPAESIDSLCRDLEESGWPELAQFPNTAALNAAAASGSPLSPDAGTLSDLLNSLRQQRDDARHKADAQRELARLRQRLLSSRRVAIARTLGLGRDLATDAGRTPEEKLASLRSAIARHPYSRHLLS